VGAVVGTVGAGVAGRSTLRATVVHEPLQYTSQLLDPMGGTRELSAFSPLMAQSEPRLAEAEMSGISLSKIHMAA